MESTTTADCDRLTSMPNNWVAARSNVFVSFFWPESLEVLNEYYKHFMRSHGQDLFANLFDGVYGYKINSYKCWLPFFQSNPTFDKISTLQ